MTTAQPQIDIHPVVLRLHPVIKLTDDQLLELGALNAELWLERTAQGDLVIMPPAGAGTSNRNAELIFQLNLWAKQDQTGVIFESSVGFKLPNGAVRGPDAAWVRRTRLGALTQAEKEKFLPLCPDFVVELRSPTDSLSMLQEKMQEYMANGAQLGWLIDPIARRVHVYRPQRQPEILEAPAAISGDPVLPGFALDLQKIWEPEL